MKTNKLIKIAKQNAQEKYTQALEKHFNKKILTSLNKRNTIKQSTERCK